MRHRHLRRAAAICVLMFPAAALAQTSPYYIGLSQTFGYDSNIFRLPDRTVIDGEVIEPESSGLISTTSLVAGLDQPIGRQRLYGSVSAGYATYGNQPQLNNPTYDLVAGLAWETVYRLSGNLQWNSGRKLGSFGDRDIPAGRGSNDERRNRLALLVRLGNWQQSSLWFEVNAVYDDLVNEIGFLQPVPFGTNLTDGYRREETSKWVSFGVRYRVGGATVVGAGVRTEDRQRDLSYDLISPPGTADSSRDSRRNDLDLFLDYRPLEHHQLLARLSYGSTDYDDPRNQDLTGWSGSLRWLWRPTGKLTSNLRLLYDTEDREVGVSSAADGAGDRQTTALQWRLGYAMTAKVSATLDAAYYNRDYTQRAVPFTDRDTEFSLGVNWEALRSTTIGCAVGTSRRSSSLDTSIGRNSYDATTGSCFVQVLVR